MGTVLFTSIQFLVALNLEPEDWRITVPIFVDAGVIAISVGWISEQLHLFYARAIQGERVAVIIQVAVTMRHEVNNALATILAEGELLEADAVLTHPEDKESLQSILRMTRRIRDSMRSEEHTSELQSQSNLVCRLLLEKKNRYRHYRGHPLFCCG